MDPHRRFLRRHFVGPREEPPLAGAARVQDDSYFLSRGFVPNIPSLLVAGETDTATPIPMVVSRFESPGAAATDAVALVAACCC